MPLNGTKRNRRVRSYPGHSLQDALRVAYAIHKKNADLPLARELLAKELSTTPKSSSFTTILSASKQYGLTEGGYRDQDISLTTLGLSAVASRSGAEKLRSLTAAAYLPSKFKALREHLQGSPLPAPEFLHGLLTRDLQIRSNQTSEYIDIYSANSEYLKRQEAPLTSKQTTSSTPRQHSNLIEETKIGPPPLDKVILLLIPEKESTLPAKLERLFSHVSIRLELLNINEYTGPNPLHRESLTHLVAATIIPIEGRLAQSSQAFFLGLALGITDGPVIILTTENPMAPPLPSIDPAFQAMIHTLQYKDDDLAQLDLIKLLTNLGTLKLSL